MTDIVRERRLLAAQGLDIIPREQWDARQSYTSARTVEEPARWFFLHISVTSDPADEPAAEAAACRTVEAIGQQRFGIGCSYNAGTMQSGRLYEMQPLTRRGAHTVNDKGVFGFPKSLNYAGRACVLVQNVQDAVTDAQTDSAARWAAAQIRAGLARPDARWYGHRDFAWKACPGDAGYGRLPELRSLTAHYVKAGLDPTPAPVPPRGDEMFSYYWKADNGWDVYVIVSGGKQVRVDGQDATTRLKSLPSHIGPVTDQTYGWFAEAYGDIVGVA